MWRIGKTATDDPRPVSDGRRKFPQEIWGSYQEILGLRSSYLAENLAQLTIPLYFSMPEYAEH